MAVRTGDLAVKVTRHSPALSSLKQRIVVRPSYGRPGVNRQAKLDGGIAEFRPAATLVIRAAVPVHLLSTQISSEPRDFNAVVHSF